MGRRSHPTTSALGKKVRHKRKEEGLSLERLGQRLGISKQGLSFIENGTTKTLRGETLVKLSQWLGEDSANLVLSDRPTKKRDLRLERGASIRRNCPLIEWSKVSEWQKNMGAVLSEDVEAWYPCPVECSPSTFVLKVRGVSMEPKFKDGEHIFVDPTMPASADKYVIAHVEGSLEPVLRQVVLEGGRRFLRPTNSHWPEAILEINSRVSIVGVVIYKGEPV